MTPLANLARFVLLWLAIFVAAFLGLGWWAVAVVGALGLIYWALVIRGLESRRQKALDKLSSTLMTNEQTLGDAIQLRSCALLSRRLVVAATSSRVILIARPLLGGFTMRDYQWKDLQDATLSENLLPNLFGSRLSFTIRRDGQDEIEGVVVADGIETRVAARLYTAAQDQEQAWEEKRRVRSMEEARASSGGISLGGYGGNGGGGASVSTLDELERAKKLLDTGVISDVEFNEIKSKILSRQAF
ncbi:MAG: SHOCT domain-containing protein [Gemmatimonadales bacterium]